MYQKIEQLLEEGYSFSISKTLSKAWQLTKKSWAPYLGFFFLVLLMAGIASAIPLVGTLVVYLLIYPAVIAGIALYAERKLHGKDVEFSTFFDGFQHLRQMIPFVVVLYVLQLIASIPMFIAFSNVGLLEIYKSALSGDYEAMQEAMMAMNSYMIMSGTNLVLYLLSMVLYLLIAVLYWWTPYFILFHGMGFWQAMESSRKLVMRAFGKHLGLMLTMIGFIILITIAFVVLSSVLMFSGGVSAFLLILVFLIAIFLVATTYMLSPLVAFDTVIGTREEGDEEMDLTQHLVG